MSKLISCFILMLSISFFGYAQNDEKVNNVKNNTDLLVSNKNKLQNFEINALAPAKAAFYSAILPGLGQAYNKKYWIIPVIYGSMGASMYAYSFNSKRYNQFLEAYKLDLAGKPHEFDNLDRSALERGLRTYRKNRDLSMFFTIGIYILNIVEANVDAHLPNKKIDTNISYRPSFTVDPVSNKMNYGASVSFSF